MLLRMALCLALLVPSKEEKGENEEGLKEEREGGRRKEWRRDRAEIA